MTHTKKIESVLNQYGKLDYLDLSRHNNNAVIEVSLTKDLMQEDIYKDDCFYLYKCRNCPYEYVFKYSTEIDSKISMRLFVLKLCPTCFALTFTALQNTDSITIYGNFPQPYLNIFYTYYTSKEKQPDVAMQMRLIFEFIAANIQSL